MSKSLTDLMNKKCLKMDDLEVVKFALKNQINMKQQQIIHSTKNFSPFSKHTQSISTNPLSLLKVPRRKGKTLSIIVGVITSIKLFYNIRNIIKGRKK